MKRLYARLLRLFPAPYREEYGDERQAVFDLSFAEALSAGKWEAACLVLREVATLPGAVLYEHLRERRKRRMAGQVSSRFEFVPGSRSETLVALAPLMLLVGLTAGISWLYSSISGFPSWLATTLAFLMIGLFLILLLVGLLKGFPRWSFPYLGMLLALVSVYGVSEMVYAYFGMYHLYDRSWALGQLVFQIYLWAGLVVSVILLVMASALFRAFRRFRWDWTLLSLLVYGSGPFAVLIAFDDYQNDEPFTLLALLLQAAGLWLYLHTSGKGKRFLALFAGLALSMWLAGAGKAILGPSQPWFRGQAVDWWGHEMMSPVIMWVPLALSLMIPAVIHFFPKPRTPGSVR